MGYSNRLRQQLTHWAVTGDDGFGGYNFAAPVLRKCRWEDGKQIFVNDSGEEAASIAVAYVDVNIPEGDWVALGDHTDDLDPVTLTDTTVKAYKVRGFQNVTNLRNSQTNRKVFI